MPHELPPPSAFRDVYFPGKRDGEQVTLLLRRHPFVFFVTVVYFILLALLPLALRLLLPAEFVPEPGGTAQGVIVLLTSAYYLFLWLFFAYAWVDYYLDLWIVTDERIINIEQAGLFNRVISEQRLIRVQDVTSDVKGFFPTFLNYGHVFVQTAGEHARFAFEQVPYPDLVKKVVLKASEEALQREGGTGPTTAGV